MEGTSGRCHHVRTGENVFIAVSTADMNAALAASAGDTAPTMVEMSTSGGVG